MLILEVGRDHFRFLECLASETRIRILELLSENPMNIRDLALTLGVSSAITTKHVQKLEEAGIVKSESVPGKRGTQKVCSLALDQVLLQFRSSKKEPNVYFSSIPVGQYSSFEVKPTCGLASDSSVIGMIDDPRYFADPEHVKASIVWFGSGWVEYRIPNFLLAGQRLKALEISLEICSEAPGYNEQWPSDITFEINGARIGTWTCPGDFGAQRGAYTPSWWNLGTNYGLLKRLTVGDGGSHIDGTRLSSVTVGDLAIGYGKDISLRIRCDETSEHCGGVTLLGRSFGNYRQDIEVAMRYESARAD
ncbi:ArsR/SmtB family transcription factor [Cohnella zeiphila]|uniref:ArsR family transcriptional regulator n=1 Tax=Cohnella zeiphila TaxID=2761120 RepID=A0A7X0VYC5_9BACL|nr:ArsR family transcriptional regulator [Cohnella zeiphila]MBB6734560.1 ArsR family transcriptional regulator [Cohnella zeiphila]